MFKINNLVVEAAGVETASDTFYHIDLIIYFRLI